MFNLAQNFGPNVRAFGPIIARLLAGAIFIGTASLPFAATAKTLAAPPITVDGSTVGVAALERNNSVFVPVRGVFEKLGADVTYTAPATIVARKDGQDLARMTVGSRAATVNGATRMLEVAPFAAQGHIMVPLRLVSEAAGATVAYTSNPSAILITHLAVVAAAPAVAAAAPVAEQQGIPWWVWALLALIVIGLILFFARRRRKEPTIRTSSVVRADPKIETRR